MTTTSLSKVQLTSALALGTATLTALYLYQRHRKWHQYWNSGFKEAGTVQKLFIYPIKSCKTVEVSHIDCSPRGSRNGRLRDREFMLVDELQEHLFLTARAYPKLVLVSCDIVGDTLSVKFPDGVVVDVQLSEVAKRRDVRRARLFENAKTDGFDCGDEVGEAFTNYLGLQGKRKLRLLQFNDSLYTERNMKTSPAMWINPVPDFQDLNAYADATSFMAISTGSVAALNKKLTEKGEDPVTINHFRPNFYINTTMPFDEDRWLHVRIGEVEFVCFRPCTRCVFTTINPETAEMSPKVQPLKTLREFRLAPGKLRNVYNNSPVFGVHMGIIQAGRIKLGDKVYVRYKPTPF